MYKKIIHIGVCFVFMCQFSFVSANSIDAEVSSLKSNIPAVSGVSGEAQKGVVGRILSSIFHDDGLILSNFLYPLRSLVGNTQGYVPRWTGQEFVIGSIRDSGTRVDLSSPVYSNSTINADDFVKNDGSFLGKFQDGNNVSDAAYTSGKVGIGTRSPTAKLTVRGGTLLAGNTSILGTLNVIGGGGIYSSYVHASEGMRVDGIAVISGDAWVEGSRVRDDSIESSKIKNRTITGDDIAQNTIGYFNIAEGGVRGSEIADGTVRSVDIKDESLRGIDIQDGSIDAADLAINSVGNSELIDNPRFTQVKAAKFCNQSGSQCMTLPPRCNGSNKALGWTGSRWICNTIKSTTTSTSSSKDLVRGEHSSAQCKSLGGSVVTIAGNKFCKFNQSSCPAGWYMWSNYTATTSKYCNGGRGSSCSISTLRCSTGGHSWGNTAVETCQYRTGQNDQGECNINYTNKTCTATVTQIGCY